LWPIYAFVLDEGLAACVLNVGHDIDDDDVVGEER